METTMEPQKEARKGARGKQEKLRRRSVFRGRPILGISVSISRGSKGGSRNEKVDIYRKVCGGRCGKVYTLLFATLDGNKVQNRQH
eukprot:8466856-Ditylum_brightwellii.AAC.1